MAQPIGVNQQSTQVGQRDAVAPNAQQPAPLQVKRTRTSTTYVGVAAALVLLVVVLVFVFQNLHGTPISFFSLHTSLPVGLLVVAAAVAGGLLVLFVSLARMAQLRLLARRHRRSHDR